MAIKIQTTFLYFDKENGNKRIYKKELAEKMIESFNQKIEKGLSLGSFGYPEYETKFGSLSKVSHIVEEIHYNEERNSLDGTIRLLNGPNLKSIMEMIQISEDSSVRFPFSIRPRSVGNINERGEVENLEIISFDLIDSETDAFKEIKKENNDEEKYFSC